MENMENKRKHLEFIQLTITRMNVNSFMVKGWLITLVAAIFVLSEKDANTKFLFYSPFATLLFWFLDAFFLSTERKFIALYNYVRTLDENQIDFSMDITSYDTGRNTFGRVLISSTILLFYPVVFVASILAACYINK